MKLIFKSPRFACLAVFGVHLGVVFGQTVPADDDKVVVLEPMIVTGVRESLANAQEIKREKIEIVDSAVAEDIGKLPDISLTDALQRISGVQILKDRGEGGGVAIRGLTQVETTLNGREVFTAGNGRTVNFADFPAEMVAGVDVYKSASANHLEGGIGGLIDVRTYRPFDFQGRQIVVSGRLINGDLVDRTEPQASVLLSERWKTQGGGEFGVLVNIVSQKRAWREDQKSTGAPTPRTDLIPGQTVIAPNGTAETTSVGTRDRQADAVVLQWRPAKQLELYAEGNYTQFKTRQDSHQINVFTSSATPVPGSATVFAGTHDLQSASYSNAPFSVLNFARDTVDRNQQAAMGGTWTGLDLTLKADVSYTKSYNNLYFCGPVFSGTVATFSQDLSNDLPGTAITGTDMANPANFHYTGVAYRALPFQGDLSTGTLDGEYKLDGDIVRSISVGVREARREAGNMTGLVLGDAPVAGLTAADTPQFVTTNPYHFFPGYSASSITGYVISNLDLARDVMAQRAALGITGPLPTTGSLLSLWDIDEETSAAYLMAKIKPSGTPLTGNLGVRVVRTHEAVAGYKSVPASGSTPASIVPLSVDSTYLDVLPSLNLRYRITDDFYVRFAASQTLTRPDFNQLSPSLTLLPNVLNPAQNQGSAGNPDLRPIRSDNFDVTLEKYFNRTTSVYVTVFYKKVDGFIANASAPETYDGLTYQVTRPYNSDTADITGYEIGYQQFFDFLPGWLKGFGVQANYTYVDSSTPSSLLGTNVPLQNLSPNSYNLIAMYETKKFSARVAYNWRDTFLSGTGNFVGVGVLPIYTRAYGWLDASLSYRVSDHVVLGLEGSNLLNTMRKSYYGVETRPQSNQLNDLQISATATVRF